jgi:hypothetical protein
MQALRIEVVFCIPAARPGRESAHTVKTYRNIAGLPFHSFAICLRNSQRSLQIRDRGFGVPVFDVLRSVAPEPIVFGVTRCRESNHRHTPER